MSTFKFLLTWFIANAITNLHAHFFAGKMWATYFAFILAFKTDLPTFSITNCFTTSIIALHLARSAHFRAFVLTYVPANQTPFTFFLTGLM